MSATPEQIIKDYEEAYKAANGRTIQVDYFKGWYALYSGSGLQTKRRARDLIRYTEILRSRIKNTNEEGTDNDQG